MRKIETFKWSGNTGRRYFCRRRKVRVVIEFKRDLWHVEVWRETGPVDTRTFMGDFTELDVAKFNGEIYFKIAFSAQRRMGR